MFDDFSNQNLNTIKLNNVKAYPSVNSPNDGGFNSEENMRWLTKAVTSRPFIIGQTNEEVDAQFESQGAAGNGMYTASGMFSVDGYICKLANQSDISFDNTDHNRLMTTNTQHIQRFIHELTNQGTNDAIAIKMSQFTFDEYNPANYDYTQSQSVDELKENLKEAYEGHKCIGYIWNTYKNSYFSALDTTDSSYVSFKTDKFENKIEVLSQAISLQNNIPAYIQDPNNGISEKIGTAFSNPKNVNEITIFYPLFFEDYKEWDTETKSYVKTQQIRFTDIFGLTFYYSTESCDSKTYPTTHSTFENVNSNNPLSGITEDICKRTTEPNNLYDYSRIYESDGTRKTTSVSDTEISNNDSLSKIFDKKDIPTLLSGMGSNPDNITKINNTLEYYCIRFTNEEISSYSVTLPVAFMISEGSLCPDGFIYTDSTKSGTGVASRFLVEGYLHFIKRAYLIETGSQDTSDTAINNVNLKDLVNYVNNNQNSQFKTLFDDCIVKPMSFYIQYTYSSLIDNVVKSVDNNDILRMKASGCGTALYNNGHGTLSEDGFNVKLNYNYTGYEISGTQQSPTYSPIESTTTITYNCDIDSDYAKLRRSVRLIDNITSDEPTITIYKEDSTRLDGNNIFIYIEDPINYLKRCSISDGTAGYENSIKLNTFQVYKYNNDGSMQQMYYGGGDSGTKVEIKNLILDEYLTPHQTGKLPQGIGVKDYRYFNATLKNHDIISLSINKSPQVHESSTKTLVNGLNLSWFENCWKTNIPYTLTVKKDNLGYLRAVDFTKPNEYAGMEFGYKLPQDFSQEDLYIYNLIIGVTNIIAGFDIETSDRVQDMTSEYAKRRRESYIHFNKLYGDDFQSLDEEIIDIVKKEIPGFIGEIEEIKEEIGQKDDTLADGTIYGSINDLTGRVTTLEEHVGEPLEGDDGKTLYVKIDDINTELGTADDETVDTIHGHLNVIDGEIGTANEGDKSLYSEIHDLKSALGEPPEGADSVCERLESLEDTTSEIALSALATIGDEQHRKGHQLICIPQATILGVSTYDTGITSIAPNTTETFEIDITEISGGASQAASGTYADLLCTVSPLSLNNIAGFYPSYQYNNNVKINHYIKSEMDGVNFIRTICFEITNTGTTTADNIAFTYAIYRVSGSAMPSPYDNNNNNNEEPEP